MDDWMNQQYFVILVLNGRICNFVTCQIRPFIAWVMWYCAYHASSDNDIHLPFNRRCRIYSGFHFLLAPYVPPFEHVKDKIRHQSAIFENSWTPFCQIWIIFTHLKLWIASARPTTSSGWKFRLNHLAVKGLSSTYRPTRRNAYNFSDTWSYILEVGK